MKSIFWALSFFVLFSCEKDDTEIITDKILRADIQEQAGIYNGIGQRVILRGVNYNVLGDYWQANDNLPTTKNFEPQDLELMADYGFNCIRLVLNWSALSPERGTYNLDYIDRIKNVIEEAQKHGIYTILDMHQDAFSKFIYSPADLSCDFYHKGWDGAPKWATITNDGNLCSPDGKRESTRAVVNAWQNFWDNTDDIQTEFVRCWEFLIEQLGHYEYVAGYDLLNEPSLGFKPIDGEINRYTQFNKKLIDAIRKKEAEVLGFEHIIFFEVAVTWNGQEIPSVPTVGFTQDRNVVFSPHSYFEAITDLLTIEQGFQLYGGLARQYETAMLIGEWGFFGDIESDKEKLIRFVAQEDKIFASSTWWQWAQAPGDPHGISWDGKTYGNTSMHLIELDVNGEFTGNINETYLKILGRTRPVLINGKPLELNVDPISGSLIFKAKATNKGITSIWIPNYYGAYNIKTDNAELNKSNVTNGGEYLDFISESNYSIEITFQ